MSNEMAWRSKYDVIIIDPPFPRPHARPVQEGVFKHPHRKPRNEVPGLFRIVIQPVWPLLQARSNQQQRVDEKRVESD